MALLPERRTNLEGLTEAQQMAALNRQARRLRSAVSKEVISVKTPIAISSPLFPYWDDGWLDGICEWKRPEWS